MSAFARISGLILLILCGSQYLFLRWNERFNADIKAAPNSSNTHVFVEVTKRQRVRTLRSMYYFYTYTGLYRGDTFTGVEEVNSQYYHLHSVGKNVQATLYVDRAGNIYSHLRDNQIDYGRHLSRLQELSLYLAMLGAGLFIFSLFRRVIRRPSTAH